jgi:D-glycero-alpha-D-manno-heptose-7-phosphate kinase
MHNVESKERQLRAMLHMVEEGIAILTGGQDITRFGKLLHEGWQAKRSLSSSVSNSYVEVIYEQAMSAGAIGGKLIGAGGGGFMLLFVHPPDQNRVRERLHKLIHVPFKFEFSGTQIIFFEPEEDHSVQDRARAQQSVSFREVESVKAEAKGGLA